MTEQLAIALYAAKRKHDYFNMSYVNALALRRDWRSADSATRQEIWDELCSVLEKYIRDVLWDGDLLHQAELMTKILSTGGHKAMSVKFYVPRLLQNHGMIEFRENEHSPELQWYVKASDYHTLQSKLRSVERERDDARQLYEREYAIVARIWEQFGSPSYDDLKGRSIHDLVDDGIQAALRLDAARRLLDELETWEHPDDPGRSIIDSKGYQLIEEVGIMLGDEGPAKAAAAVARYDSAGEGQ